MKKENFVKRETISDEEFRVMADFVKIRHESNMSQMELSKKIGIAQSTIARLEKNVHSASLSTFIKMLNGLGYHIELKKNR